MAVTASQAMRDTPLMPEIHLITASATGNINQGDWVTYSGQMVWATNSGHTAYWKNSGAGVALDSNPTYDRYGNVVQQSAIKILVQGVILASASFSGRAPLGLGAYPDATGSGVAAPTGRSGLGATWNTAQVLNHSALSGTATPQAAPVATVIGGQNYGNAGTGELVLRLMALPADVRG